MQKNIKINMGLKMIRKIAIRNYRGIRGMETDSLSKYNIFVGDNSSCRTTVMEALYSSLPQADRGIVVTSNSRGMQVRPDNIYDFFYNADSGNEIEFILNDEITTTIKLREET